MKKLALFYIFLFLLLPECAFSNEINEKTKYPDFGYEYLGIDRFENINRKIFLFNGALNKYAIRPVTVVWSSIMPKYGIDRIKSVYSNILYPRTLVSSLIQKDFKGAKDATVRFITNSTVGLGGMYDPAKRFLKIRPVEEDMEQALYKLKIKQGPYLVAPIISSTTPRGLFGRLLDWTLDPSSYIGTPVLAAVKGVFTLNNATLMQPIANSIELTYADPYDIAKKLYGLKCHVNNKNLDRYDVLEAQDTNYKDENNDTTLDNVAQEETDNISLSKDDDMYLNISDDKTPKGTEKIVLEEIFKGKASTDEILYDDELKPDIILENFNPQHPVTDAMRTALFDIPEIYESMWGEFSIWNRCFKNRIKTSSIELTEGKDKYKFKYIMQKDKNSPVAIIYPSIGEGINSHHSTVLAKLFYDEGYSVIIQGSSFQFEFVKSMPEDFRPGIPSRDAKYLRDATKKIVDVLEEKYECKFKEKVMIGTSFGAMTSLFVAKEEAKENSIDIDKYISINPPIELLFAMDQIDKNSEEWDKNVNLKEKSALVAAKVIKSVQDKNEDVKIETLPFSVYESKLITGFVLHQKLSDLIFTLNKTPVSKKTDIYKTILNTSYRDYAKKYLLKEEKSLDELASDTSLFSISDYLTENNNYRIYHSLDDYLVNTEQLKKLKRCAKKNMKLIDKGSHLGFLYRDEFIQSLKDDIALKEKSSL